MKAFKFRLKASNGSFYQLRVVIEAPTAIANELDALLMKKIVKRFKKDEVGA